MIRTLQYLLFICFLTFFQNVTLGQGSGPCDPSGICSSQQYNFPNTTGQNNVLAQYPGVNFGCLGYSPNPAWYYMQVDQSGKIDLTIKQGTSPGAGGSALDVDYAMWGPYSNLQAACNGIMAGNAPIQASYSTSGTEYISLGGSGGSNGSCVGSPSSIGSTSPPSAQAGQIYVLVITNYSNTGGYISMQQTNTGQSGAGGMSCNVVTPSNCDITAITANATCSGNNAVITGTISVQDVDIFTTGDLIVSSTCGGSVTFDITAPNGAGSAILGPPNPGTAVLNYTLTVPGHGQSCYVNAVFADDPNCNNNVQITVPTCCATPTPAITVTPADCNNDGKATITNYSSYGSSTTYQFSPTGPTVGAGGVISGMIPTANYTVVATDGCASLISNAFQVEEQWDVPDPVLTFVDGTCAADGSTTLANVGDYGVGTTYTFTSSNPSVPNPTSANIDPTTGDITGLVPGVQYTLVMTSGQGCVSAGKPAGILPMKPKPAQPMVSTTAASCSVAGTASITNYDNTYTYTFSPAGPTVTNPGTISGSAGTYTVTATNSDNCSSPASASFTIDAQLVTPDVPVISATDASCAAAGSVSITNYSSYSTGVTFVFSPTGPSVGGTGTVSNFNEDVNYTVYSTNGSCNSATASFIVNSQPDITPSPQINTTAASCTAPGSSTITNYDANNTYVFTPAGPTITSGAIGNTTPGTSYSITSKGVGTCISSAITFTDPVQLASITDPTISTTPGACTTPGTASVTNYNATYNYTVLPSGSVGAGGVISGISPNTNYKIVADFNTCESDTVSFTISAPMGLPTTPQINTTNANCNFGGSSTVTNYDASMTYNFSPSGPFVSGGGVINNMTYGTTYTITVTDGNGCTSSPTSGVVNQSQLTVPATVTVSVDPESCSTPGIATVTNYDATVTYSFNPAGPSVNSANGQVMNANPGTNYTITATSTSGCSSNASASFSVAAQLTVPPLTTNISGPSSFACLPAMGNYAVPNIAGATYTWNFTGTGNIMGNGNSIILDSITSSGVLTVIATNTCGTSAAQTLNISVVQMTLDMNSTKVLCGTGGMGTASATPNGGVSPYVYQWSNGATTSDIDGLTPGSYSVLVMDATGCSAIDTVEVGQLTNSVIDIKPDPAVVLEGESIDINSTISPYIPGSTYSWSPSQTLSCSDCPNPVATPSDTTTYYLTVTTPESCKITDSIKVVVKINCGEDFIPNVFSPNDDGENDKFIIQGRCIEKMSMKVYNRWGNLVFESSTLNEGWDGTTKGKLANTGVYEYIITVTWLDETTNTYKGTVTLIR